MDVRQLPNKAKTFLRSKRGIFLAVVLVALAAIVIGVALADRQSDRPSAAGDKPGLEVIDPDDEDTSDRALFQASARTGNVGDATIVPNDLVLPTNRKGWTVMVYMVGSNLESRFGNASRDIEEMSSAGVDYGTSNVVVYAGGTRRWQSDLPSDRNSVLDLSRGEDDRVVASTEGKADMGAPDTLSEFVNYAKEHYPAEHYALVMWDHGGGPLWGYGADENYNNDTLLLSEMRRAMDDTSFAGGAKLDLVGFDACLMGSAEVASLWSSYANYLVASEELEPGDGWDYGALAALNQSPDAPQLAKRIVDDYGSYYKQAASDLSNPDVTLAAYDLSRIGDVSDALGELASTLDGRLGEGSYAHLSQARGEARALGLSSTESRGEGYDLIDLASLCSGLDADAQREAEGLRSAIRASIVSSTSNVDGLGGLSVYFPGGNSELYQASGEDVLGDISVSDAYRAFCNDYASDWLGASPADWTLGEVTSTDDAYELQLTNEQLENLSGAYYTVLARSNDAGEFSPVLENVRIRPDDQGILHVPKDPSVLCATTDDQQEPTDWCFAQVESLDGSSTYKSLDTFLGTGDGLTLTGQDSSSSINADVTVSVNDKTGETEVRSVSAADASVALSGKQTVDVANYEAIGVNHGVSIAPAGETPWSEWPSHSWYSWTVVSLEDSFGFELVPVSELYPSDVQGFDDPFVCQLTIEDVNGGTHASDVLGLAHGDRDLTSVDTPQGTLSFELKGDHAEVCGYEGSDASLEVPSEVDGLPVTVVQELLDADDRTVTRVTLPDTVTTIEANAFGNPDGHGNKSLKSIDFGNNLQTIGYAAFCECESLSSATLPDSITSVGGMAFTGTDLKTVHIPSSLQHLGKGAFSALWSLEAFEQQGENPIASVRDGVLFTADGSTLLAYPGARDGSYEIPGGTKGIGYGAFAGTKLTSVTFPEGLTSIGNCAFLGCAQLASLDFPQSLESIGAWAFYVPNGYTPRPGDFGLDVSYSEIERVRIGPNVSHIGGGAFERAKVHSFEVDGNNRAYSSKGGFLCNKVGDGIVAIPEGQRDVVVVPDGVTTLDYGAFTYLYDADYYGDDTDIVLPDSLYRISSSAFASGAGYGDDKTYDYCLHASEGSAAEEYAKRYELPYDNVTDPEDLAQTEEAVDVGEATLTFKVYRSRATLMGISSRSAGSAGADQGDDAKRLEIPSEVDGRPVTQLGYANQTLTLPQGFGTLVIPASVTRITSHALMNVAGLELGEGNASFKMEGGILLTADGMTLVRYASDSESYEVPDGVETIAPYAFHGNERLKSVSLPSSVKTVGTGAFDSCKSLEGVSFSEGLEEIGEHAFAYCPIRRLDLPGSLRAIRQGAFYGNGVGFESLTLPDGLETVEKGAFGDTNSTAESLTRCGPDTLELGSELSIDFGVGDGSSFLAQDPFGGLDVASFSVSGNNPNLKSEGPLLLSRDGKNLYECASAYAGTVVVPDGVESILPGAFERCPYVTDIVLPESVSYLDGGSFGSYSPSSGKTYPFTLHVAEGSVGESAALAQSIPYDNETDTSKVASHEVWQDVSGCSLRLLVYPDHAMLLSVTGADGDAPGASLAIPDEAEGVPLTQVGLGGLPVGLPDEVTSLDVPGTVTSIGDKAFKDCEHLTQVTLHEGLRSVGAYAFSGTSLGTLALPEGLETVGDSAFRAMGMDLTRLRLPKSLTSLGDSALAPNHEGYYDLELPDGLEHLGGSALGGGSCGTATLHIGPSLTSVGYASSSDLFSSPFGDLRIAGFSVDDDNPMFSAQGPLLLSRDGRTLYACAPGYAGVVVVPDGVETVERYSFSYCHFVTDVVLPASVRGMDDLDLPIGYDSEDKAPHARLHAPAGSVAETYLRENGIPCDNETSVPEARTVNVESSGVRMSFLVTDQEATLCLCSGTSHGQSDSLVIPSTVAGRPVTTVGLHGVEVRLPSFVTSLEIPSTVSSIGEDAFYACSSLQRVTLHEGLRTIGRSAFYGCSLSDVSLPEGVEAVGEDAFYNTATGTDPSQ